MCPRCGQNAPLVYRGVTATCAACGAPRLPLAGKSLQLVGQPSLVGGTVARIFGWIVIVVGLLTAIGVGVGTALLFGGGVGAALGLPVALLTLLLGLALLRGGSKLHRSGASAERDARAQAIAALASHKGGRVTAAEVASSLEIPRGEAEALLDALAREDFENVAVDVDADGTVLYRFNTNRARVRIDPDVARSPNREEWERLDAQAEAERRSRAQR